jgi:hypothetical protein
MSTAGSNSFIANQLYAAPTNTLDGLFNLHLNGSTNGTMPDGTALLDGSVIQKWDGGGFLNYTWSNSTGWLDTNGNPAGGTTLNPGEGAVLVTSNATTVTFVGLVGEGALSNAVQNGTFLYSSILPQSGGLVSNLGYPPKGGDRVQLLSGGSIVTYTYIAIGTPRWTPSEPIINVGESFYVQTSTNKSWVQNMSPCH